MPCFIFTEFTKNVMSAPILSELKTRKNEQIKCKTAASQRGLEWTILYNHSEVDGRHCYWSILLPWQAQGSCDAPASVHLYSNTGWPHAKTPHFSYHLILHIFNLKYSTIRHQLNYYCRIFSEMRKNWLIMLTVACGSRTMLFFCWSLMTYASFSCSLSLSLQKRKEQ